MNSTIKLERITLREIALSLVEPFRTSAGVRESKRTLLLEVLDAEGVTAWSECVAFEEPHYLPETIASARNIIERFAGPIVLGRTFAHPREIKPALDASIRGNEMAKAAVEMAAWAIAAEKSGQSIAKFIGGTRNSVATGLAVGILPSSEALAEKATAGIDEGYHRIKVKIARGKDVEWIEAACRAVGGGRVMVDANCAYTLEDAGIFRAMDEYGLMMIEQPLAWDDVVLHAALQRELSTPICLDESLNGLPRVRDMAELGSGRIVSVKPGRVGGLGESIAIHDFCIERQIPLWCGGMLETGIGRAYNVALASLRGFTLPGDLSPSRRYWKNDLVSPEWDMDSQGNVSVPMETPGLGVQIDTDRILRTAEKTAVL